MLDVAAEIIATVAEAIFGEWYARQPVLIKVLVWGAIIALVLFIASLFLPQVVAFFTSQ